MPWALIEGGMASVAATCIIPLQDIMGLDNDARMNLPGTPKGTGPGAPGGGTCGESSVVKPSAFEGWPSALGGTRPAFHLRVSGASAVAVR